MTRPTTIEQGIAEAARKARRSCLPPSILFLRAKIEFDQFDALSRTRALTDARGGWFARVLGDLAAIGYDAQWDCIQAGNLGAAHIERPMCRQAADELIATILPISSHGEAA